MKITNNRSGCPISTTLDLFGDRWSLLIIRDLFLRRTTFTQFLNAPEKIATNILRDRLKKLMSYGIIKFQIDQNDKKLALRKSKNLNFICYGVLNLLLFQFRNFC